MLGELAAFSGEAPDGSAQASRDELAAWAEAARSDAQAAWQAAAAQAKEREEAGNPDAAIALIEAFREQNPQHARGEVAAAIDAALKAVLTGQVNQTDDARARAQLSSAEASYRENPDDFGSARATFQAVVDTFPRARLRRRRGAGCWRWPRTRRPRPRPP